MSKRLTVEQKEPITRIDTAVKWRRMDMQIAKCTDCPARHDIPMCCVEGEINYVCNQMDNKFIANSLVSFDDEAEGAFPHWCPLEEAEG